VEPIRLRFGPNEFLPSRLHDGAYQVLVRVTSLLCTKLDSSLELIIIDLASPSVLLFDGREDEVDVPNCAGAANDFAILTKLGEYFPVD